MKTFADTNNSQPGWALSPHACRHCLGRVLVSQIDGVDVARCAECEASAIGVHRALCCCGSSFGANGQILECYLNPTVSKAVPQIVLVREFVSSAP